MLSFASLTPGVSLTLREQELWLREAEVPGANEVSGNAAGVVPAEGWARRLSFFILQPATRRAYLVGSRMRAVILFPSLACENLLPGP